MNPIIPQALVVRWLGLAFLVMQAVSAGAQSTAGFALEFQGTTQHVRLPAMDLSAGQALTLEAWVKPADFAVERYHHIVRQDGWQPDWVLAFYEHGTLLTFGLSAWVDSYWPYIAYQELTVPITPAGFLGAWRHVAATYDGQWQRLYCDGVPLAGAKKSGSLSFIGGPHAIGAAVSAWAGVQHAFAGRLDEVRIWSVARTEAEINQTMSIRLVGNEPGLVGYWRLDEGAGKVAGDSSGHGRNGSVSNAPLWVVSDAPIGQSVAVTLPARAVLAESAALHGWINPLGRETLVWFEYGLAENTLRTAAQNVAGGQVSLLITQAVGGLLTDTVYRVCCVASNETGLYRGYEKRFKTAGPPAASTLAVMDLTLTAATVAATVNPNGLPAAAWFEWGTNQGYGLLTSPLQLEGGFTNITVTNVLIGLLPGMEYHYRVRATNSSGVAVGLDASFRTYAFSNSFWGDGNLWSGNASLAWGDGDRDGDLDLVMVSGFNTNSFTRLYRNEGASWAALPYYAWGPGLGLPNLINSTAAWGDYDNDGDLDLLLTGELDGWPDDPVGRVFRNDGGLFTNAVPGLPEVGSGGGAWGDYDNDGLLDFVLTGDADRDQWTRSPTNMLYHNTGNGTFADAQAGLPAIFNSSVAWGDFDNDGQLDLLLAGDTGAGCIARVYHNDQGVFTDIGAGLPGVASGSVAWGDFDRDGWLDVLLAGSTDGTTNGAMCRVYRNSRSGTFADISATLPGVFKGTAAWGDYDNDGQLDVLLTGVVADDGGPAARIYRNDQGVFADLGGGLSSSTAGGGVWGDFDGDGRMDVAIVGSGANGWGHTARGFRNYAPAAATPPPLPDAPLALNATTLNDSVTLCWDAASDAHTPASGLTYNLRVGTTPGGGDIVPPHSDAVTGQRHLPAQGNAQHRLFAPLTNLPVTTLYWSVQSVNNAFVGSPWAAEQSFVVSGGHPKAATLGASNVLCCSVTMNGMMSSQGYPTQAWFDWGVTTNLGTLTSPQQFGPEATTTVMEADLSELSPNTTYYFRLTVTNRAGVALGRVESFTTPGPPPVVSTLAATNIGYGSAGLLGESPFFSPVGEYSFEWGPDSSYGYRAAASVLDAALLFDGGSGLVEFGWGRFPDITNSFTLELWANPTMARRETAEATNGTGAVYGQRLAVFPEQGARAYGTAAHAGVGLSIGTNGVSVIEHTDSYFPAVLVYTGALSGWTHVALVYSNHEPRLHLNGTWVRTGLVSDKNVHPSIGLGITSVGAQGYWAYGPYAGWLQEVRLWQSALDAATLQHWRDGSLSNTHPAFTALVGYWPLNEGQGSAVTDRSSGNRTGQLQNGVCWSGGRGYDATILRSPLSGLAAGATYHFRLVGTNAGGTVYGNDETFTTLPLPRILGLSRESGDGVHLHFRGVPGREHLLETSTNLTHWSVLTALTAGPDGSFDYQSTGLPAASPHYFRLKVP